MKILNNVVTIATILLLPELTNTQMVDRNIVILGRTSLVVVKTNGEWHQIDCMVNFTIMSQKQYFSRS